MDKAPLDHAAFNKIYDESIIGREFVESRDYYEASRTRFRKSVEYVAGLGLLPQSTVLDIGGGIMAVLLNRLFGVQATVGDVNPRAAEDVEALGFDFVTVDLFRGILPDRHYDLVVMTEVIEHIPKPPYLVLREIAEIIRPGGYLFMTTPNGHRFRNLAYMLAGKEILGIYKYPKKGEALGHQHEYTLRQLHWQSEEAGFEVLYGDYYEPAFKGETRAARLMRLVFSPTSLLPRWRDGLAFTLRRPVN